VAKNTLVSTKMIRGMAMAYTDGLLDKHITGKTMTIKGRDTDFIIIQARMNTTDNGRMTRDLVKEHTHILLLD
jgi:hypothetical protein